MWEYLFEFADALVLYNTAIKNLNTFVIQIYSIKQSKITFPIQGCQKKFVLHFMYM